MSKATEKRIEKVVRKTVLESVQGLFNDPDSGLVLKESVKKRLINHKKRKKNGLVSLREAKSRHS